jgi:hypothetical protein
MDSSRLWVGLQIQVPKNAHALFNVAVDSIMGSGETILFWKDIWLNGHTILELAPNMIKAIPKRTINRQKVSQALLNQYWVNDIRGALSVQLLVEYLYIWDQMEGVALN